MSDPRITLARPQTAPVACEGRVRARSFFETTPMRTTARATSIRASAKLDGEQIDQLLFGETFDIARAEGAFGWGQAARDGYVGWVALADLSESLAPPTHWVTASRAFAYAEPAVRAPSCGFLSLNALTAVTEMEGPFARVEGLGWIPFAHLAAIGSGFRDPLEIALGYLGAPYLWGGRDGLGVDCSGLVQQALYAAGRSCPRDADQQSKLGREVASGDLEAGDLVAWSGHIGMMIDSLRLLHANAHHMAVAIEPLATAVARIAGRGGGEPTAYRRV